MAYPTGSGSETLFRGSISGQSNDATAFRWDRTNPTLGVETYTVPALHIITVVSIVIANVAAVGTDENFDLYVHDGAANIHLLNAQPLAGATTFTWNDRIVLVGGDKLIIVTSNAANVDVLYSFIDQDWS